MNTNLENQRVSLTSSKRYKVTSWSSGGGLIGNINLSIEVHGDNPAMKTILLVASMAAIMISALYQPTYGMEAKPVNQKRNMILGLRKVDWSDLARQNEYLNCVISAVGKLGKTYNYDYLACISGCSSIC